MSGVYLNYLEKENEMPASARAFVILGDAMLTARHRKLAFAANAPYSAASSLLSANSDEKTKTKCAESASKPIIPKDMSVFIWAVFLPSSPADTPNSPCSAPGNEKANTKCAIPGLNPMNLHEIHVFCFHPAPNPALPPACTPSCVRGCGETAFPVRCARPRIRCRRTTP